MYLCNMYVGFCIKNCFIFIVLIFICLDIDECMVNFYLCQNGGSCLNKQGLFECMCVEGWIGLFCIEGS